MTLISNSAPGIPSPFAIRHSQAMRSSSYQGSFSHLSSNRVFFIAYLKSVLTLNQCPISPYPDSSLLPFPQMKDKLPSNLRHRYGQTKVGIKQADDFSSKCAESPCGSPMKWQNHLIWSQIQNINKSPIRLSMCNEQAWCSRCLPGFSSWVPPPPPPFFFFEVGKFLPHYWNNEFSDRSSDLLVPSPPFSTNSASEAAIFLEGKSYMCRSRIEVKSWIFPPFSRMENYFFGALAKNPEGFLISRL